MVRLSHCKMHICLLLLHHSPGTAVQLGYVASAATAWVRNKEAFKNRAGKDYKIQQSFSTTLKF